MVNFNRCFGKAMVVFAPKLPAKKKRGRWLPIAALLKTVFCRVLRGHEFLPSCRAQTTEPGQEHPGGGWQRDLGDALLGERRKYGSIT